MHHERIHEIRQALIQELEALDRSQAQVLQRMQSGGSTGYLSPEEAALVEGDTHAQAEERARLEIEHILSEGSRTSASGLTRNAEAVLEELDKLLAGVPYVGRAAIERAVGFGEPHLGAALSLLKAGGYIDGSEVEEEEGPIAGISLLPMGRAKLVELMRHRSESIQKRSDGSAFLMMPFDESLNWLHELIAKAGDDAGIAVVRADDIFAPGIVIDQIKRQIDTAQVVIAVCTGRNANVFFELGYSSQRHQPIIIAENASHLPFDVQHFRAHLYGGDSSGNGRETLRSRLASAIGAVILRDSPTQAPPSVADATQLSSGDQDLKKRELIALASELKGLLNQVRAPEVMGQLVGDVTDRLAQAVSFSPHLLRRLESALELPPPTGFVSDDWEWTTQLKRVLAFLLKAIEHPAYW